MNAKPILSALLTLAAADAARAHATAPVSPGDMNWTLDPWIVAPLAVTLWLFVVGAARLRARGGGTARRAPQGAAYAAGWFALAAALVSPLHWLGEHLFTFHMIEHEIVMAVAAPLLVVAQPGGTLLWGLPHTARLAVGHVIHRLQAPWCWLTRPGPATLLHGIAIWAWHVPSFFDAALASETLHRLQHLSFFCTALLFWWSMLRRCTPGVAIWHLFVTMLHTSILGAWMTLLPRVLYHLQTEGAPAFGLTPLEDQQLAGVIMWVPAETAYAGAALYLAAQWIRRSTPVPARVVKA